MIPLAILDAVTDPDGFGVDSLLLLLQRHAPVDRRRSARVIGGL